MKTIKAIKFLSIALLTLGLSSCRNNDTPEDVHEHEEVNKIKVTYTNTSTKITQEAVFQTGSLVSKDAINLVSGQSYDVNLTFYHNHDGKDEDLTSEVIKDKDEHFVKYKFSDIGIDLVRAEDDTKRTDGKKLGLKTRWTVTSAPQNGASVGIQLMHQSTVISDSGIGITKEGTGSPDVNAFFEIK